MSGFNTQPILKGMQGTRPITPQHIFTSDSPLMESWGLCSFTKDNLDFISNYGNFQKIFNKGTEGDVQTNVTYNSIIDDNKEEYINITVWRNKGRNGEYIKYEKLSDWKFEDTEGVIGAKGGIYKEKDLKLDDFITEVEEDEENQSTPVIRSKIFAHILIALNTHVNTLDETQELETKDKVRIEFLTDIMSSKERCISWNQTIIYYDGVVVSADQPPNQESSTSSGEDEFSEGDSEDGNADELEGGVGPDQATSVRVEYTKEQTHECEIKLYLYSIKDGEIKDNRSVCLKNLNFTNPRSTYDFGEFLKKEDGKLSDLLDSDNPNNDVAAPLDLQYVEYLGRWESGSAQMIAMISEGIPPAETIDIDYIEKNPTEKLLDHETGQQIVYGSAIPIHMQNGNPKQWCATYDKLETIRETDDFQKSAIRVHNLSDKGFARGELVVLNRIEGLWFPITSVSSSGVGGGLKKLEPADPQWEFMYLMTSADFHFQTDEHEKLTPFDYEKGFYRNYYDAFKASNEAIENQNKNANVNRYADSFKKFAKVRNEYFQISSFDFVNQNLGGVRSATLFEQNTGPAEIDRGHAISNTIYGEDLDGTTYGHGEKLKTYPFFGCVFPEGHSAGAFIDKILNAESNPADYADVKEYGKPYPGINTYSLMEEVYYGTKEELAVRNDVKAVIAGESKQTLGLLSNLADSNFKHVPADIATNAGPNGRWGRPIEWVGYFNLLDADIYSTNPEEHTSCDTFLSKIQTEDGKSTVPLRGSFLYVKGQGEDTPASGYDNYWYDIQPLNHYSIQFRPLSRELYASFEGYDENQKKYDFVAKGLDAVGLGGRGDVSNRMYQAIEGFRGPLSKTSWHRNLAHLQNNFISKSTPAGLIGNYGLKYSSDLVYNTPFGSDNRLFNLPANVDGTDDGYPFKHWDSDWMKKDGITMRPGGAIGIIGAVKTVRSRDTIAFSTDNIIGLGDHLVVTTPLEYGSTMKNGDIDDQLTTALYARVYQHHPRHLTWYDPRFMVVHHFSAGDGRTGTDRNHVKFKSEQEDKPDALFEDGIDRFKTQSNSMFVYYATHENGVVFEDELEDFDFSDSNENYDPAASGYFLIDKVEYNVDFRVPTNWNKGNIPTDKKRVFSDSTTNLTSKLISVVGTTVEQMREVDHWNVNNNRRSKLLPYSYRFKTIGISKSKGVQFSPSEGKVNLSANNTAVVNKGSGYKVGDKFEVIGGVGFGTVFTVTSIGAEEVDGQTLEGVITGISIAEDDETGMRYEPQDFVAVLKEEDGAFVENEILWDDENTPSSSLSLQPISDTDVTGTGFEAYVFYGEVVLTTELTDIKPLEALDSTGPIKLTPNIPRNDTNRNQDQIITPVGNSYQILNTHFDHKYDIFLRYHNDISHVTMNDTNPPNASEQQVTLTVGVNLGQAPTSSPSDQLGMSFDASDNAAGSLLGGLGGDPFSNFDEDSAADGAGSFLGFGGGVGGNSSFR